MALSDLDPDRSTNRSGRQNVVFGDATRLQSLSAAGLSRASGGGRHLPEHRLGTQNLRHVHEHAPQVPVVVRTLDDASLMNAAKPGATVVVPEAIEGSLMLASQALVLAGVPIRRCSVWCKTSGRPLWPVARLFPRGRRRQRRRTRIAATVVGHAHARPDCVGRVLGDILRTHELKVIIVSVRRASGAVVDPSDDLPLLEGDTWSCPVVPKI